MKERLSVKLKDILVRNGTAAIFATHDHGEAFFFSDKIYVLRDGRIEDGNSPYLLYTRPAIPWVASFMGEINYISGHDLKTVFRIHFEGIKDDSHYLIRPEELQLFKADHPENPGTIETVEYYGFYRTIIVSISDGKIIRVKDFLSTEFVVGEKVDVRIAKTVESISLTGTSDYQGEVL
jgi:ABC-type Fe3+/spermidine/putrescine transport system ATPase subunit